VKTFNTIARTIQSNYEYNLNYFDKRSTNASAEFFNEKSKSIKEPIQRSKRHKLFPILITENICLISPQLFGLIPKFEQKSQKKQQWSCGHCCLIESKLL
jgi:hypothetical protein